MLFRMACPLMQAKLSRFVDLRQVPLTFLHGNPHIDNYVKTNRGSAMMDFDRSRMGPYCWDIIRFLASLHLRKEEGGGFLDDKIVEYFLDAYIVHYSHTDIPHKQLKMLKGVKPDDWQRNTREYLKANKKWARKMRQFPVNPKNEQATLLLTKHLESRNDQSLLNDYSISELGLTPGSLGKKHFIYALMPKSPTSVADAILMDIKEVYEERDNQFFYNPYPHHGQRMIEASKIYAPGMEDRLGFCTINNKQFWGREIPSFAVKVKKYLNKEELCDFAYSVGSELGRGHRLGFKDQKHPELLEKDLTINFDKYFKISKLFAYEISLAFDTMERKLKLYQAYKVW